MFQEEFVNTKLDLVLKPKNLTATEEYTIPPTPFTALNRTNTFKSFILSQPHIHPHVHPPYSFSDYMADLMRVQWSENNRDTQSNEFKSLYR